MIETKEHYRIWKRKHEGEAIVETFEALREVARAVPGMFEIAEIAMPDSYFQSDSRLKRMRKAQDTLPDWLTDG